VDNWKGINAFKSLNSINVAGFNEDPSLFTYVKDSRLHGKALVIWKQKCGGYWAIPIRELLRGVFWWI